MATSVQNVCFCRVQILDFINFNVISWIFMTNTAVKYVFSLLLTGCWAFIQYLSLVLCCQRLSVELDPHRGVVNWLFLSLYQSNMVLLLCRASQEAVLQRSGHVWVLNCVSFPERLKSQRYKWAKKGENSVLCGRSVDFSVFFL